MAFVVIGAGGFGREVAWTAAEAGLDVAGFCDDDPEAQRIVREWPAERMVFGTDYFWRDQAKLMAWVKALRPDPAERSLVFGGNARRLLGLS